MLKEFKHTLLVLLFINNGSILNAQGLQVGDKVPDLKIKRLINYKSDSEDLKNLIGDKALLIDFWFATCTACFESFPTIDSIQKEFQSNLNVLLVSHETKETTRDIFGKIKRVKHIKLPSAVSDTLLALLFPHNSAPHEIWIDRQGIVKAITDHRSVTRENIQTLVSGKDLTLPTKKDYMAYTGTMPIIKELDVKKTIKYSYISSYQPGIPASIGLYFDAEDGYLKSRAQNFNFKDLYFLAYGQLGKNFNYSRISVDSCVEKRLRQVSDSINVFCYERWWRDTTRQSALEDMQIDFDRFFKVKSSIESRNIPCIVLRTIGTFGRYKAISQEERAESYSKDDSLFFKNVYLKYVIENILNYGNYAWSPQQFIDETGYTGRMSFALPQKYASIDQVNEYLKNYDLKISIQETPLDVITIKENNEPVFKYKTY